MTFSRVWLYTHCYHEDIISNLRRKIWDFNAVDQSELIMDNFVECREKFNLKVISIEIM